MDMNFSKIDGKCVGIWYNGITVKPQLAYQEKSSEMTIGGTSAENSHCLDGHRL